MQNRSKHEGDDSRQEHADAAHADQRENQARQMATDAQAQRASDEAHRDMVEADKTARSGNPFSLTNVIPSVSLLFGGWMAEQIYGGIKDAAAQSHKTSIEMHDALMAHGFKLDTLQVDVTMLKSDVAALKANCMNRDAVDDRIRLLAPHSSVGATDLLPHRMDQR